MNEKLPTVDAVEQPVSSFEKHRQATLDVDEQFASALERAEENRPATFVCPSGIEMACENGWDEAIARAQAAERAAHEIVGAVEGEDRHRELAAKKLYELKKLQSEILVREAELAMRRGELHSESSAVRQDQAA